MFLRNFVWVALLLSILLLNFGGCLDKPANVTDNNPAKSVNSDEKVPVKKVENVSDKKEETPVSIPDGFKKESSEILSLAIPNDWIVINTAPRWDQSLLDFIDTESPDYRSSNNIAASGANFSGSIELVNESHLNAINTRVLKEAPSAERKPITVNGIEGIYYKYTTKDSPGTTFLEVYIFDPKDIPRQEGFGTDPTIKTVMHHYLCNFKMQYFEGNFKDAEKLFAEILKTIKF